MKKFIALILVIIMSATLLVGCGGVGNNNDGKISIVTTIFPEYDWVMNIIGDNKDKFDVTMLLDNGVDLHSYQPTTNDIVKITTCDIFVYVGSNSDAWVEDVLKNSQNPYMIVINLMDVLKDDIKEEETVEGMQEEEEEDEGEVEYDAHVWLSLKSSKKVVSKIFEGIVKLDEDNKEKYETNTNNYLTKLDELDSKYEKMVKEAKRDTILFGDRFPFRYLVDDYGIEYYAAFVGCSAESEASFETIAFLSGKVDELGLTSILTLEGGDKRIANTIVETANSENVKILSINSMQSTTSADVNSGTSYLSIMENNLEVLREALN